MTTSDTSGPPADPHVVDELPALIGGELDLDATRDITHHLRACTECRRELVDVAAGIGIMRRLDQTASGARSEAAKTAGAGGPAPVPTARPHHARLRLLVAAAALLIAGVAVTATLVATRGNDNDRTVVSLAPVSNTPATGEVAMRSTGSAQAMEVKTSLGAAPPAGYYEVWLLDRDTGKMLPVGVLPPDGRGVFRLPSTLLQSYDTVDISLQPDNGTTAHSSDSLLRADYA